MVLDPDSSRSIRVVSLNGPLTKDRIYRVLIEPQIGDMPTEAGTDRSVAVKILTAYEALVIARPTKPAPTLVAQRTADGLVLTNTGNSNTLLYDGQACEAGAKAVPKPACAKMPAHRMYAGHVWKVPLPHPTDTATFQLQMGEASDPIQVKY